MDTLYINERHCLIPDINIGNIIGYWKLVLIPISIVLSKCRIINQYIIINIANSTCLALRIELFGRCIPCSCCGLIRKKGMFVVIFCSCILRIKYFVVALFEAVWTAWNWIKLLRLWMSDSKPYDRFHFNSSRLPPSKHWKLSFLFCQLAQKCIHFKVFSPITIIYESVLKHLTNKIWHTLRCFSHSFIDSLSFHNYRLIFISQNYFDWDLGNHKS